MTISASQKGRGPDALDLNGEVPPPQVDFSVSLASLRFISAAIRRATQFCVALAIVGLLVGIAVALATPRPHQASTSLVLTNGPEVAPDSALEDDQAVVQSRTVARLALGKLGLSQPIDSFIKSYKATVLTDRVLVITVSAPSDNDAVSRANAIAKEFLAHRASQLEAQQNLELGSLSQQVSQANQQVASINGQLDAELAQPASPTKQADLTSLRAKRAQATNALAALEQSLNSNAATTRESTASQVLGSTVLDPAAPIPPASKRKRLVLYGAVGLVVGLLLALGLVVVRAFVTERTYRRDDVALALAAPVKISVGRVRRKRWLPAKRRLAAMRSTEIQRIVSFLVGEVRTHRAAALAIVPIDNPDAAALSLVSTALSCAREGQRILVVDLVTGAPAARLVGVKTPGIHEKRVHDLRLLVAIPQSNSVAPVGPLALPGSGHQTWSDELAAAYASADIILTLAALDPSLGAEHLATWTDDVVVLVTAGRSSWSKIHAVGQMVRLARMRLVGAILVGAERTDESLGAISSDGLSKGDSVDGIPAGAFG